MYSTTGKRDKESNSLLKERDSFISLRHYAENVGEV